MFLRAERSRVQSERGWRGVGGAEGGKGTEQQLGSCRTEAFNGVFFSPRSLSRNVGSSQDIRVQRHRQLSLLLHTATADLLGSSASTEVAAPPHPPTPSRSSCCRGLLGPRCDCMQKRSATVCLCNCVPSLRNAGYAMCAQQREPSA